MGFVLSEKIVTCGYLWIYLLTGTEYKIKKLSELREENPDKCVVIGTLFKHQVSMLNIDGM